MGHSSSSSSSGSRTGWHEGRGVGFVSLPVPVVFNFHISRSMTKKRVAFFSRASRSGHRLTGADETGERLFPRSEGLV